MHRTIINGLLQYAADIGQVEKSEKELHSLHQMLLGKGITHVYIPKQEILYYGINTNVTSEQETESLPMCRVTCNPTGISNKYLKMYGLINGNEYDLEINDTTHDYTPEEIYEAIIKSFS